MALRIAGPRPSTGQLVRTVGSKVSLKYPKAESYGAELRCSRLRQLQRLLSCEGDGSKGKDRPQILLGILGIDSRYNEGAHELIEYLTFGGFESTKSELEKHGYDEEDLSDAMICIRSDRVDVYCSLASYHCLLPHMGPWKNLQVHCLGVKADEDTDDVEQFKVKTLIAMVGNCKSVGLPFSARGHRLPFDVMKVEQWPIIQAYALEGYGRGTFFTLEHTLMDLSDELHALYRQVDPAKLVLLTTEVLPCFVKQWDNMEKSVDVVTSGDDEQSALSTAQIAEPLLTYHSHGQVGLDSLQQATGCLVARKPYVFFGKDSSRISTEVTAFPSDSNDNSSQTPTSCASCTHMVIQALSPRNDLCCSRTYFLESVSPSRDGDGPLVRSCEREGCRHLRKLYRAAIEAVTRAVAVYCASHTHSVDKASQAAHATLEKERSGQCTFSVNFAMYSADDFGRVISVPNCGESMYSKTAEVVLSDIVYIASGGSVHLGSITFGESFLESVIWHKASKGEDVVSLSSEHVILTRDIPRWNSWMTSGAERQRWSEIPGHLSNDTSFGKLLLPGHAVDVAVNNCCMRLMPGSLFAYERGVAFINSRAGPLVLPHKAVKSIEFYDGDSPSVPATITYRLHNQYNATLPDYLQSEYDHLVFVVMPKTKSYKSFFSEVLHAWKSPDVAHVTFSILDELPDDIMPIYEAAQARLAAERSNSSSTDASAAASGLLSFGSAHAQQRRTGTAAAVVGLNRFINHLTAHCCLGSCVARTSDLPAVLKLSTADEVIVSVDSAVETESPVQLVVTIVSGVPGSHKENLCNALTALAQENSRWVVFKQPLDAAVQRLNVENLQATIQQYYGNLKKKKASSGSSKCSRMLIVTPGYTEAAEVVRAVLGHPNKEVAAHVKIGAVTTCVDPLNAFAFGKYTLPRLLDMCALGWVNNILFTSCTDGKSEQLHSIQEMLRAVNNNVAFLLAEKGDVTRSTDIDLILSETAFNDASLRRSRILCYPECPEDLALSADITQKSSPMSQCVLKFSRPIVKAKLLMQLKALKHSLDGFSNGIYHVVGRLKFEDSDAIYEVTHATLSSFTNVEPATTTPTSPSHSTTNASSGSAAPVQRWFIIFIGYRLQEESSLKDWLRKCAVPKPDLLPFKAVDKLTAAEKKQIHLTRHHEALPPGWFYNGSHYVSLTGERSDMHPDMDRFMEEFVHEQNRVAKEYNERVSSTTAAAGDLFD